MLQTSTGEGRRFNNLKAARVASRRGAIWKSDCDTFSAASVFSNSLFHCHYHQNRHGKQNSKLQFNQFNNQEEEATSLVGQNSTLVLRENDSGSLSCHDVFGTLHCQTLSSRLKAEPDIKRDLPTRTKVRDGRRAATHSSSSSIRALQNFCLWKRFWKRASSKNSYKKFQKKFRESSRPGSYQKAIPPKIFRLICPSENRFVLFKSWYFIPSSHKQNFCNGVFSMLLTLYPKKFLTVHYGAREHATHALRRSLSFENVNVILISSKTSTN